MKKRLIRTPGYAARVGSLCAHMCSHKSADMLTFIILSFSKMSFVLGVSILLMQGYQNHVNTMVPWSGTEYMRVQLGIKADTLLPRATQIKAGTILITAPITCW